MNICMSFHACMLVHMYVGCMSVRACMHAHMYVGTYGNMYVCMHESIKKPMHPCTTYACIQLAYMYTCMQANVCVDVYIDIHVYTCVCICMYFYLDVCVGLCMCKYVYVCTSVCACVYVCVSGYVGR